MEAATYAAWLRLSGCTALNEGEVLTEGKPACEACKFSTKEGCSKYDSRPEICRGYICLWAMGVIPEDNFPMDRGVCWSLEIDQSPGEFRGGLLLIGHCLDIEKLSSDEKSLEVMSFFLDRTNFITNVILRDAEGALCITKDGKIFSAVVDPRDPMKVKLIEEKELDKETYPL